MDLNMLISTIITATAALTAIIGGFLVSRVITLASDKNSIKRRLREIESELNSKKEMLSWVEDMIFEEDLDDFIETHAEDILIEGKPVEAILEEDESIQLTADELKPHIDKLKSIYKNLKEAIDDVEDAYVLPKECSMFAKDTNIKINDKKHWHEKVYQLIKKTIFEAPRHNIIGGISQSFPRVNTYEVPSYFKTQAYIDRFKDRNRLGDEVEILSGIKNELSKQFNEYGDIQGLWTGLAVLIYACMAGIIFPGMLLIFPTQMAFILNISSDLIANSILVYLFFSELFVIFIYLGVSMYMLTKTD